MTLVQAVQSFNPAGTDEGPMKITVTVDDELYSKALEIAEPTMDQADIFSEALRVFVRVQAAKRLAALGGAAPQMSHIARRRGGDDDIPS